MMDSEEIKPKPQDGKGWDGKQRVKRKAVITNPEALSDPEYSDEDAPPTEQIDADEGGSILFRSLFPLTSGHGRPT